MSENRTCLDFGHAKDVRLEISVFFWHFPLAQTVLYDNETSEI